MSTVQTSAIVIAGTLIAASIFGIFRPWTIKTEIAIDAPPSVVWAILSETESFEDWNPFIRSISGDLVKGNTLETAIQLGEGALSKFTPTVLVANANQELRWLGGAGIPKIFDGEHYFILEETAQGTTLFRHGENFSGILIYAVMPFIGTDTQRGFEAMNTALKEKAEADN